jgi:hypothetical protein
MSVEEIPPLARKMVQQWEEIMLMGHTCTAFVVRREDLIELRHWSGLDEVKQAEALPSQFHGARVYALGAGEGVMLGDKFVVVRSEDLARMKEVAPLDRPLLIEAVEPGECWAFAEEGEGVPRSD